MAARIVYEGSAHAGGGGGGDMFAGLKLFFTQRVPMRAYWEGLVKANGGSITLVDRAADIVVADHARQNPTEGSTSWKWVEDSIKGGVLKDKAEYTLDVPAHSSTAQQRTGPRSVTRQSRIPYSADDDRELKRYCLQQARLGKSMAGNVIYQDFERKNPRHTAQSWRDRWLKKLQHETITDEDREAAARESENQEHEQEEDEALPSAPIPVKPATTRVRNLPSRAQPAPQRAPPATTTSSRAAKSRIKVEKITPQKVRPSIEASPPVKNSVQQHSSSPMISGERERPVRSGNPFTDREIGLLVDEYDAILNLDSDQMIDAWLTWERAYPTHTAQEWSNYFNNEIKGKVELESPKKRLAITQSPGTKSSPAQSFRRSPRTSTPIDSSSVQLLKSVKASQAQESHTPPQAGHEPLGPEIKDSQESSNKTVSSNLQARSSQEDAHIDLAEINFNKNVEAFAAIYFPNHEVELYPTIFDARISLYNLWRTVGSDDFGSAAELNEHDGWPKVAALMCLNAADVEEAGKQLRDCYNEIIHRMTEYLRDNEEPTESQTNHLVEAQLRGSLESYGYVSGSDEEQSEDVVAVHQHSLPSTANRKRSSPHEIEASNGKRARIDKGKGSASAVLEIPSTPEVEIKTYRRLGAKNLSPLRDAVNGADAQDGSSGDEELRNEAISSPTPVKSKPMNQTIPPIPRPSLDLGATSAQRRRTSSASTKNGKVSVAPLRRPRSASKEVVQPKSNGANHTNGITSSRPSSSKSNDVPSTWATAQKSAFVDFAERMGALGYPQHIIIRAVQATSMKIGGNSSAVMESLRDGNGIPDKMAGVWTDADDKCVHKWRDNVEAGQLSKAQHIHDRLASKHGVTAVEARNQFLLKMEKASGLLKA